MDSDTDVPGADQTLATLADRLNGALHKHPLAAAPSLTWLRIAQAQPQRTDLRTGPRPGRVSILI
jgi:hypothetical protein